MWRYYLRKYRSVIMWGFVGIGMILLVVVGVMTQNHTKEDVTAETFAGTAMGTAIKKTIYSTDKKKGEMVNKQIDECLAQLDNQLSVRNLDSDVAKCNRNYAVDGLYELPSSVLSYLKQELAIYEETKGAFSPCVRPLSYIWGIEDGTFQIPQDADIQSVLKRIDASAIEVKDTGVVFDKSDMAIDFGATGKGIACDEVIKLLEESDAKGAIVSIGGSIAVYGSKDENKEWHVGIRDPRGEEEDVMAVVDCESGTVISTSGDYEKYFEVDGKRYHHILDPNTGYPADTGLMSVTIICDDGLLSDAMSTACFVMGLDKGMKYAEKKGVEAIFVTKDKQVYITDGIRKEFRMMEDSYKLVK